MTVKQKYDKIVFDTAIQEGLNPLLASFMVSQANHESAEYTSNIFLSCNNAFGYKYVGQQLAQPCTGSPEGDKYARYNNVSDSAKEIARWIKRRMVQFDSVKTPEEYAEVLKRNGYFGDNLSTYQKALNKFWYPAKGMMNTAVTKYPMETLLTGVTFFGLLTWYIVRVVKNK